MVRATFSGFNTALSALQANQKRLDITGQNLSNMNTAGYTRQQLEASSLNYTNPVSHYSNGNETAVGFGVSMDRVSQIRDPYLDIQYRSQSADCSYTNRLQTALNSLSKVLDETTISGIRKAFDDVQSTLTSMQDPAKNVTRLPVILPWNCRMNEIFFWMSFPVIFLLKPDITRMMPIPGITPMIMMQMVL